ncbi:MAG: HEPN domain-containing protein [Methanomassiliicoccaceae archaeon]|nr:HEPN domain-containing protein [Methanomassiliicoccaceae archaeon]
MRHEASSYVDKAKSDLMTMDILRSYEEYPKDSLCFHAQQYAEKMIKAKLADMGIPPSKTHDLVLLLEAFPDSPEIQRAIEIASELGAYAVDVRYPGVKAVRISEEEAEIAYESAIEIPYLIGLYQR